MHKAELAEAFFETGEKTGGQQMAENMVEMVCNGQPCRESIEIGALELEIIRRDVKASKAAGFGNG